ncbi:hypothetical protein MTO96_017015 [Rhipicephalus appendiculatus]
MLAPSLVLLMKTDVVATFRTFLLHRRETKEARELFKRRYLDPLKSLFIMLVCMFVFFGIQETLSTVQARAAKATPAASGDI